MLNMATEVSGAVLPSFPPLDSPLRLEHFFKTLYLRYDERYVYSAPRLSKITRRILWAPASPVLQQQRPADYPQIDYEPRIDTADD